MVRQEPSPGEGGEGGALATMVPRGFESAAGRMRVPRHCWPSVTCWRNNELVAGRTSLLTCWLDDESVVGWMMVPQHRWPSLPCLCNGSDGGADNDAIALLAVPRSLARQRVGSGADNGAHLLALQQVGWGRQWCLGIVGCPSLGAEGDSICGVRI